jgi:uncharacterized membrane protein YgaE (UPF0421/DUF939 family)
MKSDKIDKKAMQSGLSVFLCVILGPLFHVESLFYASIAAVITAQTDVFESFKVGKNRIYGTFIGVVIGILFAMYYRGNPMFCGIGVFIIVYMGHKIWGTPATNVACVAFIAIMLDISPNDTPLEYGTYRFLDTTFGVAVSVFASYFLFHNPLLNKFYKRFFLH